MAIAAPPKTVTATLQIAEPPSRRARSGEVFATLYNRLGIDVNKVTLTDFAGRPQYLVPDALQPMPELI